MKNAQTDNISSLLKISDNILEGHTQNLDFVWKKQVMFFPKIADHNENYCKYETRKTIKY